MPRWIVLPILGALGGLISGSLIHNFAPSAKGAGVSHIIAFLRHKPVPMGLRVGIVKLFAGIIAIGSGFPLGPEGPAYKWEDPLPRNGKMAKSPYFISQSHSCSRRRS